MRAHICFVKSGEGEDEESQEPVAHRARLGAERGENGMEEIDIEEADHHHRRLTIDIPLPTFIPRARARSDAASQDKPKELHEMLRAISEGISPLPPN